MRDKNLSYLMSQDLVNDSPRGVKACGALVAVQWTLPGSAVRCAAFPESVTLAVKVCSSVSLSWKIWMSIKCCCSHLQPVGCLELLP